MILMASISMIMQVSLWLKKPVSRTNQGRAYQYCKTPWRTYTDSNQGLYRIGIDITEKGAVSHHYEELQAFHKIDAAWYAIYLVADKHYKQRASINKQLHCCVGRKTNLKVSQRGVLYEVKTVVQVS